MDRLSLKEFCGGALQEKVNEAAEQVFANLQNPNTPWKNKRNICVTISFQQNEDRDDMAVDVAVTTKLAPVMPKSMESRSRDRCPLRISRRSRKRLLSAMMLWMPAPGK